MPPISEEERKILTEVDRFLVFMYGHKYCEQFEEEKLERFHNLCDRISEAVNNSSFEFILSQAEVLTSILNCLQYGICVYSSKDKHHDHQPQIKDDEFDKLLIDIINLLEKLTHFHPMSQMDVKKTCSINIKSFNHIDLFDHNEVILEEIVYPEIITMMNGIDNLNNTAIRIANKYIRESWLSSMYGEEEREILRLALSFKDESELISFELEKYYSWTDIYRSDRNIKKLFDWWITITNANYRKKNNLSGIGYNCMDSLKNKKRNYSHGLNIAPRPSPHNFINYSIITNTKEYEISINNKQLFNHSIFAIPFDKKISDMEMEIYIESFIESHNATVGRHFNDTLRLLNQEKGHNADGGLQDGQVHNSKSNFYVNYRDQVFKLLGGLYLYEKCFPGNPQPFLKEILDSIEELLKKIDPAFNYADVKEGKTVSEQDGNGRSILEGYGKTKENIEGIWKDLTKSSTKFRI